MRLTRCVHVAGAPSLDVTRQLGHRGRVGLHVFHQAMPAQQSLPREVGVAVRQGRAARRVRHRDLGPMERRELVLYPIVLLPHYH